MSTLTCMPGEIVFAAEAIYNDGSLPEVAPGVLLAAAGTRGVVVKTGHVESAPEVEIVVVRFEGSDAVLGPPVGCFADELTQAASAVAAR